jgi:hypothetical protein
MHGTSLAYKFDGRSTDLPIFKSNRAATTFPAPVRPLYSGSLMRRRYLHAYDPDLEAIFHRLVDHFDT